jgi:PTS system mannitol-specific IIC component
MMKTLNRMGRFLSTMVFQNIAGLIALGMLRVMFGSNGWWPIAGIDGLINPMTQYFVPILFGYTGGKLIGDQRGGVIAAFAVIGLVAGNPSDYSMILPAMIMGPAIGMIIKKTDLWLESRIPLGLEMLCYNSAAAFIGLLATIIAYYYISPGVVQALQVVVTGSAKIASSGYLFLIAFIIEPAKIFFFNNVINHGFLEPLGIHQMKEYGKSVFFMLESNPGPGFGMLMAYFFCSAGQEKGNIKSSIVIQLIGGIHEVYFPYALQKPLLIFPLILGGMAGDFIFSILHAGLVAAPTPGSILTFLLFSPRGVHFSMLLGFAASAAVSFAGSYFVLNRKVMEVNEFEENNRVTPTQQQQFISNVDITSTKLEQKVVFACDAGMGSSALGAAILRKKLKEADLHFVVENCSVDELSNDADIVISHMNLTERARASAPYARHFSVNSFLDHTFYQQLIDSLKHGQMQMGAKPKETVILEDQIFFTQEHIMFKMEAKNKWEALLQIGQKLIRMGHVEKGFVQEMRQRELIQSTYIGNGVAIPHGMDGESEYIIKSGIVIAHYPKGINFGSGETAYLLIAVVGRHFEKIGHVAQIAYMIDTVGFVNQLIQAKSKKEMYDLFSNSYAEKDRIK